MAEHLSVASDGGANLHRSKSDAVYEALRQQILQGSLEPGSALNQQSLAAALGVSTTPVREALRRLESEGLVQMPPHRDVVVAPLDLREFIALYEVREELDTLAASLAARNYNAADEQAMRAAADALTRRTSDRVGTYRQFHSVIYRASHNDVAIEWLDRLWNRSDRYRRAIRQFAEGEAVVESHLELVEAVLSRDEQRTAGLMRTHIRSAQDAIEAVIADGPDLSAGRG